MKLESLHLYGRLLRFLRPHLGTFLSSVFFMTGFAAFSGFTLAMIVPFTEIVLNGRSPSARSESAEGIPTGIPGLVIPLGQEEPARPTATATTAADSLGGTGTEHPVAAGDAPAESLGSEGAADGEASQDRSGGIGRGLASLRHDAQEWFYSLIVRPDRGATIRRFCLALFLIFLIKNLFWYAQSYLVVKAEQNVIRDIRNHLFGHYQALSMDYFSHTNSGVLISRITNDIELVKGAIANGIADLVRQALLLIVYLVTVLLASWQLFLFAVMVLPPNLWLIDRIGQTLRRSSRVSQVKMGRITSVLGETLASMRIVKAFGLEGERVRRFERETGDYARTLVRMTRIGSLASPLTEMLGVAVAVAILWFAGSRVATEGGSTGRFLLFIVGMLSMMQPIKVLSQVNVRIQQGLAAAGRIFEVLDTVPSVRESASARGVEGFHREIRLETLSFSYREGLPVLRDVDLRIGRGEVVALVGPSGGGKSTLADLIPRFHDPTEGRVTLDGVDLREIRLADLRRMIGFVTQETILFEGTILENIRMGRPEATLEEVEAAAAAANAREFIDRLPDGYQTAIGERGRLLSGGQRQRLAIARAILRNPEILVFDEATSSLDTESEAQVQSAIENLLRSRTAIVIAHRLSTVRGADRIVVLDQGRIVQEGKHADLVARPGLYRKLYEMQFREEPAGAPEGAEGSVAGGPGAIRPGGRAES